MRVGATISAGQQQRQTVSPRLAQAIGMLSMDAAELDAMVDRQVERNPFLSRVPPPLGHPIEGMTGTAEHRPSLREHLQAQIATAFRDPADAALALRIADELDDGGYLRASDDALASALSVALDRVRGIVGRCRSLDPPGLFARDLGDCFGLQLSAREELDEPMRVVLSHLNVLAAGDWDTLSRATRLADDTLRKRIERLRRCDPKPGAGWGAVTPATVLPVARVRRLDGRWTVQLLPSAFPRVTVDDAYAASLSRRGDARGFVREALSEARWLERALRRRARTISLVVNEVVRHQSAYFERGDAGLRPLTKARVAQRIGMHETTVGRAVSDKAVETPVGTVGLARFFSSGVASADGAMAATAVGARIRSLVEAERPDAVLSDEALTALLRAEGVAIARRTVAKYREGMAIGSSARRRREKRGLLLG